MTDYVQTGVSILANGGVGTFVDYARQFTISGNEYHSAGAVSAYRIQISPEAALASPQAHTGVVVGNTFDTNAPGIYLGQYAGQITTGVNSWPLGSSNACINNLSASKIQMPTHGGVPTITLANGDAPMR